MQLWATFVGAAVAGLSLIAAGIVHGSLIADGAPPDQINGTLTYFRLSAAGGLGLAPWAARSPCVSLFMMYTTARRAEYALVDSVPADGVPADAVAAAGT